MDRTLCTHVTQLINQLHNEKNHINVFNKH